MTNIHIKITTRTKRKLESIYQSARDRGDIATVKRIMAIFAVTNGNTYSTISLILKISEESIRLWIKLFILKGPEGLIYKKAPGRPPKLTKSQKRELDNFITEGPEKAGFPGACWRSPMIQTLIYEKFGIFYSVNYIVQLLKNMDFTYQKARFTADDKDPEKRKKWLEKKWPEILKLAKQKNSYILFGDEASFPQWGSLTYTWAKKGVQPVVKTSGIRKGYKVLGLIDYFTGRFFYKAQEGRLNSESYIIFLKEVLKNSKKHIILIQDGAKYHTSKVVNDFFKKYSNRIKVYQLPSYSPDYNPIEKLWKKIKEKETHLHYFPTFDSLMNKVDEALIRFKNLREEILALFGFYSNLVEI